MRMLEILSDKVYMYRSESIDAKKKQWKLKFTKALTLAPVDLAEFDASILYNLFSPDLSEYVDINLKDRCWVIRSSETPDH